jgi:hypothetical protein
VPRRLPVLLVLGVAAAVTGGACRPAPPPRSGDATSRDSAEPAGANPIDSVRAARAAVLRQIAAADTYLPAALSEGDSVLKRWPQRLEHPLLIYLPEPAVIGYRPELGQAARDAFGRWQRVGDIPVTFRFVRDSAGADVVVRWVHEFPMARAGQADIRWRGDGWIQSATLTLATAYPGGAWLSPEAVHTVAMHEIGHLLGLGHSDHPRDVMFPTTAVHDITPRDRRTVRLLYAVPPGSLRLP